MNLALSFSRKMIRLAPSNKKALSSASSTRMLQPAFGSWQEGGAQSNPWTAAVTLSAVVLLGAGSTVSCEHRKKSNVIDPNIFPAEGAPEPNDISIQATSSAPKDPMTVYAKMAIKREMEKNESSVSQQTQATSPASGNESKVQRVGKKFINELTADELRIENATRKAKQHSGGLKLFSGNGNMALSLEIARHLGINLGKATVGRFADGEANIVIHENVRGKDVYVIQPTCPPVNDNIMELLLMVSTLRRASARRITVVIPYYGYARQDRKMQVSCPEGK